MTEDKIREPNGNFTKGNSYAYKKGHGGYWKGKSLKDKEPFKSYYNRGSKIVDMPAAKRKNVHSFLKRNLETIRKIKSDAGCFRCGEKNWIVLDFHHRDASLKNVNLKHQNGKVKRKGIHTLSSKDMFDEINKCDIVCANCHRIIEHEKRNQAEMEVLN